MHNPAWYVRETPCYPCAFKVDSDHFRTDNDAGHFFETGAEAEAEAEADRRNANYARSLPWQDNTVNYLT